MAEAKKKHPPYMAVWGGLFVLTMVEVGVAFLGLGRGLTIIILLLLAIWKALLVALYYMHLRFEPRLVSVVAAAPLLPAAILVVAVLIGEYR